MTSCCARGSQANLSIDGVQMDFVSFDGSHVMKVLSDGSIRTIRGNLEHLDTDVNDGILFANFTVSMYLGSRKAATLLPLMGLALGGTPPITHQSSNTVPSFTTVLTTEGGLDFSFTEGFVGKWTLSGQKGSQPVMLTLHCSAKALATAAVGTYTHTGVITDHPYAFTQGVYKLNNVAQLFDRFALQVDHGLIVEHNNSITATQICATDRSITLGTSVPFSTCNSTTAFMTGPLAGLSEIGSNSLDFTNGSQETKILMTELIQILSAPSVTKSALTRLPLHFRGYANSSTAALQVVNTVV